MIFENQFLRIHMCSTVPISWMMSLPWSTLFAVGNLISQKASLPWSMLFAIRQATIWTVSLPWSTLFAFVKVYPLFKKLDHCFLDIFGKYPVQKLHFQHCENNSENPSLSSRSSLTPVLIQGWTFFHEGGLSRMVLESNKTSTYGARVR